MAYVERDKNGEIIAVYESLQNDATEYIALDSPELVNYIVQSAKSEDAWAVLSNSDIALVRVLEDLINTLIDQKIIMFTDLPMAAREKVSTREKIRGHLNTLDNLVGNDEGLL